MISALLSDNKAVLKDFVHSTDTVYIKNRTKKRMRFDPISAQQRMRLRA